MWQLSKKFTFEASHKLPNHDGKCARLHGHSWHGTVHLRGGELQGSAKAGMVMDYADIKSALNPLLENYLDHWHLNDSTGLENPTSEEIARWIYNKLKPILPLLYAVEIQETCTNSCIYIPESE